MTFDLSMFEIEIKERMLRMGKLIEGKWWTSDTMKKEGIEESEIKGGAYGWLKAQDAYDTSDETHFLAESGRYVLYISLGCPFASRAYMAYQLKNLQDQIDLVIVNPELTEAGWSFVKGKRVDEEPILDAQYLREVFIHADPTYTGPVTVPLLYDKRGNKLVSTESTDIVKMLDTAFPNVKSDFSLYPDAKAEEIDAVIAEILQPIIFGVYAALRAKKQKVYEGVVKRLFKTLDYYDKKLGSQAYVCGELLTMADIFLFVTLIRFDAVYYPLHLCNLRLIRSYPNLSKWLKRIYDLPGIEKTVDLEHIKTLYYLNREVNPSGHVPLGPGELF